MGQLTNRQKPTANYSAQKNLGERKLPSFPSSKILLVPIFAALGVFNMTPASHLAWVTWDKTMDSTISITFYEHFMV